MTVTAENIAKERELADLVRNKSYFLDDTRLDIDPQMEPRKFESVVPVLTHQFQCHWNAFLQGNFARLVFEARCGDTNDLFVVSHCVCRSNGGLLQAEAGRNQ